MFGLSAKRRSSLREGARLFDLASLGTGRRGENEAVIRELCANAYLGHDTALCRVLGRYKMFVDTTDIGHSSHLLLDGYWEMWVTEAMAAVVRPGMTAVDIGANLGYFTLLLADLVGESGQVHAFEPNPAMTTRLRRTISVNGFGARTTVHQVALSDSDGGQADLIIPADEPKNAHIVPAAGAPRPTGLRLSTRRLDSFDELAGADFIKIDADTAEEAIWRGASGLFRSRRPLTIFLEFAPARYADPDGFLQAIGAAGFQLNWIRFHGGMQPATPSEILAGSPLDDRMLALRR